MNDTIKTSEIVWREDLYPREKPNAEKIQTYSECTDLLPPIEINQNNILIDGYHRWRAFETANIDEIPCVRIETQSEQELLFFAVNKNSSHGLQLSVDEKKQYAIKWWDVFSEKKICETLCIHKRTFSKWTANKRHKKEETIKKQIIEMWMRCETQESIANELNISRPYVVKIAKNVTDGTGSFRDIFRNFTPELYGTWNFGKSTNKVKHFGNIPPEIVDNLLYYYTKPFDVVYDPFGGGGITIDVCKKRKRRYYVGDLTPIPARITEIRQHDITSGLPNDLPVPDFVFLDPPYWKQAEKKYSDKKTDLGNVNLEFFIETIGNIARDIKRKWQNKPDARLAIIAGICKLDGVKTDLPHRCYNAIEKYLDFEDRFQVPYSTQVYGGAYVKHSKENKEVLYINRDLIIFKVPK